MLMIVMTLLQLMAGRCTAAFYQIMGVLDCIASDIEDYVRIAVRIGLVASDVPLHRC